MVTNIIIAVELFFSIIIGLYFLSALKGQQTSKININKESNKELDELRIMRDIKLSVPLSEKSRPTSFDEIIGQEKGIQMLKAALCGANPQHVLIYGPPGVGKTAAARLVLEYAQKSKGSPFRSNAKFIEIDATTVRFDDRGIADPLIGSVHDPIYQGAGPLGVAGIPQPKPGAVTKAHGGVLFIDEIGELHPIEMNKLLKVLEDRKVFLDSVYYSSKDTNMPRYVKDIFDNGLPADFRLVAATTRNPEEIIPALRSRCVEIFFRELLPEEIRAITKNAVGKANKKMDEEALKMVGNYASNGREAVNLVQLTIGIATDEGRENVTVNDLEKVIENGRYSPRLEKKISEISSIGNVNGLAVYGANIGTIMEIEASAKKVDNGSGTLKITGIVDEEEINTNSRRIRHKSNAKCSVENVISVLQNILNIDCKNYDIHVNFLGGVPVDGPSAGISIATAIYSAINKIPVKARIAMTGEISLHGEVKPVGGINAKVQAAIRSGAKTILIPKENWSDSLSLIDGAEIIPVRYIKEVFEHVFFEKIDNLKKDIDILTAEGLKL